MKDGTSDVGGQKRGGDGERCLRNAEGKKNRREEEEKKSQARKRHTPGGKSILCLKERPSPKVQLINVLCLRGRRPRKFCNRGW